MNQGADCLRKDRLTEAQARARVAALRNRKRFRGINAYRCRLDPRHWHIGRSRFASRFRKTR
jgi:hypothetical protein